MNFLFPYMARWKAVNWTRYHQLFNTLAEMGHLVYILQPPPANLKETNFQEIDCELPKNLHLIDVPLNSFFWGLNLPFSKLVKKGYYSLCCRKIMKKTIKEKKIDAMMVYNIPQYFLMKDAKCFKIFDIADDYIDMLKYELGKFGFGFIIRFAEKMLLNMVRMADLSLVVSHTIGQYIKEKAPNSRFSVVPNGININEFSAYLDKKADINRKGKRPIVGFIGAFEYFIDFELMLNAFRELKNADFLMVGSGRQFERVKKMAVELGIANITFTGGLPHSQVIENIEKMDICLNIFKIMPVSDGACPLKLFEYLIMKKPVISSRFKEMNYIDEGFVFFADTSEEIADTVNTILNGGDKVRGKIEKGYAVTLEKYNWEKITKALLSEIKKLF